MAAVHPEKVVPARTAFFYLWTYVKELFPNDVETPQQKLSVKKTILTC